MRRILVVLILANLAPAAASAQEAFRDLLKADFGEQKARADYTTFGYFNEDTSRRGQKLHLMRYDLRGGVPVFQNETDEVLVRGRVSLLDVDTGARIWRAWDTFPNHLWYIDAGVAYRHKFENGWIAGGDFALGSASDKPFNSDDEIIVSANAFLRLPDGENNAWVFLLNYYNNRQFLPNAPIPGVAYEINVDSTFNALLGVPFTSARWEPVDRLTLDLAYILPRRLKAEVGYRILEPVKLYAGYVWDNERFLRHNRRDNDDRIFYFEQRVFGGVRWDIIDNLYLDFSGGFAFDRFFFEGEDYTDRGQNRIDVNDSPYLMLRVGVRL
jgi:hypothetical protein